jgi:hypothetical protein
VGAKKFDTLKPAIEAEPQVKNEVIDPNCFELSHLTHNLVGITGNQRALEVLCGFKSA